ncbi:uncharacterized protein METZ01_LOCUS266295, partial [marine metagenome]
HTLVKKHHHCPENQTQTIVKIVVKKVNKECIVCNWWVGY